MIKFRNKAELINNEIYISNALGAELLNLGIEICVIKGENSLEDYLRNL